MMKNLAELELKVQGKFPEVNVEPWSTLLKGIQDDLELSAHFDARSLHEAGNLLQAYSDKKARLIAAGTDIMRLMKQRYLPVLPDVLVNIKTVPNLNYVKEENEILKIGALTSLSDIEASDLVKTKCSILAETSGIVASPQIRNMATVAGSICQDLSCWYYRAARNYYNCRRKGGDSCPAREGDNRWMFSIFGAQEDCGCYATCQSDMAVTLTALGASIKTTRRIIPIEQFYTPHFPGNVLSQDEVIEEVQIPVLPPDTRAKYSKFSIRNSIDHPLVSVACLSNDSKFRVVIGGVSIAPYVVSRVQGLLCRKAVNEALAEKAAAIAAENANPMSLNVWKVQVMKALVKRTILAVAWGRAAL